MNLKLLFKPYILFIILLGFAISTYSWITDNRPMTLDGLVVLILAVVLVYWEDLLPESINVSLAGPNIFLLLCLISIKYSILCTIGYASFEAIMLFYIKGRRKKLYSLLPNILFNICLLSICACSTWILCRVLKTNFTVATDYWKVVLLLLINIFINCSIVQIGMFLKDTNSRIDLKKLRAHFAYEVLLSILLVYTYNDRGLIGILFVYFAFIPIQKITSMYVKLKTQEEELFMDSLTKVHNYKYLSSVLSDKVARKTPFSLIVTDLDRFKDVNDLHGHNIGNKVLQHFSEQLKKKSAASSMVCRFGGDEFCIITDGDPQKDELLKNSLKEQSDYFINYGGKKINYTSSYGFSHYAGEAETDWKVILEAADKEMYLKKEASDKSFEANKPDEILLY
jgi:diguanylate cyclase (GGDEF)-like protein